MCRLTSQGSQFDFFSLVANVKYAGLIKHKVPFLSGYYSDNITCIWWRTKHLFVPNTDIIRNHYLSQLLIKKLFFNLWYWHSVNEWYSDVSKYWRISICQFAMHVGQTVSDSMLTEVTSSICVISQEDSFLFIIPGWVQISCKYQSPFYWYPEVWPSTISLLSGTV